MINIRLPKFFEENIDTGWTALKNKCNSLFQTWEQDIKNLVNILDPARCPAELLDELGYMLATDIKAYDSETIKRRKIYYTIANQMYRTTFDYDVKIKIKTITSIEPELYSSIDNNAFYIMGHETSDPDYYWGSFGTDGIDDNLGAWIIGDMTEFVIPGNIYIDLKSAALPAETIAQIVEDIKDSSVPAYMRVYLGYVIGNVFTVYAGGVIE